MEGQYGEHPLECESSNLHKDGMMGMNITKNPAKAKKKPCIACSSILPDVTKNMNAVMNLVIIGRH